MYFQLFQLVNTATSDQQKTFFFLFFFLQYCCNVFLEFFWHFYWHLFMRTSKMRIKTGGWNCTVIFGELSRASWCIRNVFMHWSVCPWAFHILQYALCVCQTLVWGATGPVCYKIWKKKKRNQISLWISFLTNNIVLMSPRWMPPLQKHWPLALACIPLGIAPSWSQPTRLLFFDSPLHPPRSLAPFCQPHSQNEPRMSEKRGRGATS